MRRRPEPPGCWSLGWPALIPYAEHGCTAAGPAVLLEGPHRPFLATKLELADIAYDVLLETGVHIQPLPLWEEEWEHPETFSNPRLIENIRREGIPL